MFSHSIIILDGDFKVLRYVGIDSVDRVVGSAASIRRDVATPNQAGYIFASQLNEAITAEKYAHDYTG